MKLLMLPGDGIGPQIVDAALLILAAADKRFGLGLQLEHDEVGFAGLHKHGTRLRQDMLDGAKACDGIVRTQAAISGLSV